MGSLQALEALKLLLGRPSPVAGTLRRFDALAHEWQCLQLPPIPTARCVAAIRMTNEYSIERYRADAAHRPAPDRAAGGAGDCPQGVAVALNGAVLPRSRWPETRLNDGDEIHLFTAIAGG